MIVDKIEEKLWSRVEKYKKIFELVPFVKIVFVCNSLSFGVVDDKSDIDLFIVTKKNGLFFARFILVIIMSFLGIRRYNDNVAGRFCLSFFVDEECMDLSKFSIKNDFYLLYWTQKLVPIYGSKSVLNKFIKYNRWAFPDEIYIEDRYFELTGKGFFSRGVLGKFLEILWLPFHFLFGWILKYLQIARARKKYALLLDKQGTLVSDHVLKFHNNDKRVFYRDVYLKKFGIHFSESNFLQVLKENRVKIY